MSLVLVDESTLCKIIARLGGNEYVARRVIECATNRECTDRVSRAAREVLDRVAEISNDFEKACIASLLILSNLVDPTTSIALDVVMPKSDASRYEYAAITLLLMVRYVDIGDDAEIERIKRVIEDGIRDLDKVEKLVALSLISNLSIAIAGGESARVAIPLALAMLKSMDLRLRDALKYLRDSGVVIPRDRLIDVVTDLATERWTRVFGG